MIPKLSQYERVVGKKVIKRIRKAAEHLEGKHCVMVNSTASGGGVAEILNTLVFLLNDVGIRTGWRVLFGSHSFFKITKGMHNSLQGQKWKMSKHRQEVYLEYCSRNSVLNHIKDHDIVVIHDPQPLGMIKDYETRTTWIWRCHIDLSHPNPSTMDFILPYINNYDGAVISTPKFRIKKCKKPQFIIPPSIDPLSVKNKQISHNKARRLLNRKGINRDKPIISQISRFDPWKNPFGVVKMYKKIKEQVDCQLVLMGDFADDDPQGHEIYHKIIQETENLKDIHIITEKSDLLVNALQRESHVVFQNSVREGFALTVSEALWKKTPVIATPVGGIPLQIINGKTGYLIRSQAEGVKKAIKLLKDEDLRKRIGNAGHKHVKKNFLITRHLEDYIKLFSSYYPPPQVSNKVIKLNKM